ncbi:MAG: FecR family protein [Gemmataceae bacterium]
MNEWRDRLLDVLLREELGGETPPDLSAVIPRRTRPRQRWRWAVAALAASVLMAVGIFGGWRAWYADVPLTVSGPIEIVEGDALRRGAVLRTGPQPAELTLGGYSRIQLEPRTMLSIGGARRAEEILLRQGAIHCSVARGQGSFVVRTPIGTVSVVGTEFSVRFIEERGDDEMLPKHMIVRVLVGTVVVAGSWGVVTLTGGEERAFADEKQAEPAKKTGTVVGVITNKGENFIEVKADGEAEGRRYVPRWVGGLPKDGGGPDKTMLKVIRELKVGSRVRIEWFFEERPRVVKVEVIKASGDRE